LAIFIPEEKVTDIRNTADIVDVISEAVDVEIMFTQLRDMFPDILLLGCLKGEKHRLMEQRLK